MVRVKIDQPIVNAYVGSSVVGIVEESVRYERERVMVGRTYKIKPPALGCAMYITINDMILPDGGKRPFEIFVASKNTQHFQWITALTRMMSAVFQKPGDLSFVVEELKQVFDPQGGYFEKGKMVQSVVAHIGLILEEHFESIGAVKVLDEHRQKLIDEKKKEVEEKGIQDTAAFCPACGSQSYYMLDGCMTCVSCGESKCG